MSLSGKGRLPPSASPSHVCGSPVTEKKTRKRKEKGRDVSAGSAARIPLSPLVERSRERAGEPQRWIIVRAGHMQLLRSKDQSVDMKDSVFTLHTVISYR